MRSGAGVVKRAGPAEQESCPSPSTDAARSGLGAHGSGNAVTATTTAPRPAAGTLAAGGLPHPHLFASSAAPLQGSPTSSLETRDFGVPARGLARPWGRSEPATQHRGSSERVSRERAIRNIGLQPKEQNGRDWRTRIGPRSKRLRGARNCPPARPDPHPSATFRLDGVGCPGGLSPSILCVPKFAALPWVACHPTRATCLTSRA